MLSPMCNSHVESRSETLRRAQGQTVGSSAISGFRSRIKRSRLADANERKDCIIWADLAAVLIRRACRIYIEKDLGLDLYNAVYAINSNTKDLCVSIFP